MENSNCKNLLIKSSENNIFFFKDKGWHFFTENQKFIHFSYKNFLINILLNVKIIFLQKYGVLEKPNADYLTFYRKRGTNIIPFFGPYFGAIPSTFLILMVNPIQALYFLIFILALQQLDGNVIGPKILGVSTGVSGFWMICSITVFGGLFGLIGMLIGVPTIAVVLAGFRYFMNKRLEQKNMPIESMEYLNVEEVNDSTIVFRETIEKNKKKNNKELSNQKSEDIEADKDGNGNQS